MKKGKAALKVSWKPKYRKVKKGSCWVDERDPLDKIFEELNFHDVEESKLDDVAGISPRSLLLSLHSPFKEADWETRVEALETCCKAFADESVYKDLGVLDIYIYGMARQFQDHRASVCLRASRCVTEFLKARQVPALYCAVLLHHLYTNLSIRNKVLNETITKFGEILTKHVNDDDKKTYFWELCTGLENIQPKTREACTRYLTILVSSFTRAQLSDDFLEVLGTAITKRLNDAKADTRVEAIGALKMFQKLSPERANKIPKGLPKALNKKYQRDGSEIFSLMDLSLTALKDQNRLGGMEEVKDEVKDE